MCTVVNFDEYRGNKNTKKSEETKKRAKKGERPISGLSTDALINEFKQNGRSVFKLVLYIIEQYGCIPDYSDMVFEEVKRDMKYSEICPEITNKRLKAPLGVKMKGEWYALEVVTSHSAARAMERKWEIIGNYNVKGFCLDKIRLSYKDMQSLMVWRNTEHYDGLKTIVEEVLDCCSRGNNLFSFECRKSIIISGEENERHCIYKMLELSLPDYAILEGTEIKTGDKHLLLFYKYKGREPEKYAKYYREKYSWMGIPLLYAGWHSDRPNWKSAIEHNSTRYKRFKKYE